MEEGNHYGLEVRGPVASSRAVKTSRQVVKKSSTKSRSKNMK
jgi:hypothetical protein